jgi:hypothetical protein
MVGSRLSACADSIGVHGASAGLHAEPALVANHTTRLVHLELLEVARQLLARLQHRDHCIRGVPLGRGICNLELS